jgi:hypothetical protein
MLEARARLVFLDPAMAVVVENVSLLKTHPLNGDIEMLFHIYSILSQLGSFSRSLFLGGRSN